MVELLPSFHYSTIPLTPLALTATLYSFEIALSDVDRNVYETIAFKAAQQPSETDDFLMARVLAYALEFTEGIGFSGGIAEADQPAIFVRDLTGTLKVWIDVGVPDAARLHKASKTASRVVVYTHKDPRTLIKALSGEKIHRAKQLEERVLTGGAWLFAAPPGTFGRWVQEIVSRR